VAARVQSRHVRQRLAAATRNKRVKGVKIKNDTVLLRAHLHDTVPTLRVGRCPANSHSKSNNSITFASISAHSAALMRMASGATGATRRVWNFNWPGSRPGLPHPVVARALSKGRVGPPGSEGTLPPRGQSLARCQSAEYMMPRRPPPGPPQAPGSATTRTQATTAAVVAVTVAFRVPSQSSDRGGGSGWRLPSGCGGCKCPVAAY
jgi:hypothetical protein